MAGSLFQSNEYWILTHRENQRQKLSRGKYETFNKRLPSFICKCARYIFFPSRTNSRSETAHLLLKIILASFKLHYFFLTSNALDEYFAVRTQIRSDALSCFRFPVSVNSLYWAVRLQRSWTFIWRSLKIQMFGGQTCHLWTHLEPIFSLRVHVWIQTTLSLLAGLRKRCRKRTLSFTIVWSTRSGWLWCSEDHYELLWAIFVESEPLSRATLASQDCFACRQLFWQDLSRRNLITRQRK